MELKQVKEFNKETVTQEVAAKLCAILIWNHFDEEKYANTFKVENGTPYGTAKSGGGSVHPWTEKHADNYVKTASGVKITPPHGETEIRIMETGSYYVSQLEKKDDEWITIRRNAKTNHELHVRVRNVTHGSQIRFMQCLLDHNFYIIEQ